MPIIIIIAFSIFKTVNSGDLKIYTPVLTHPHTRTRHTLTHSYKHIPRIQIRKNLIDKSMFTAFFLFPLPCEPSQNRKICLYVSQNTGEFLTILHIVRVNHLTVICQLYRIKYSVQRSGSKQFFVYVFVCVNDSFEKRPLYGLCVMKKWQCHEIW